MARRLIVGLVLMVTVGSCHEPARPTRRNVIVMVADGTSFGLTTLARWYKGAPLALDSMLVGAVRTASASSVITDSAASATAFATGHSTDNRVLGLAPCAGRTMGIVPVDPEIPCRTPIATVLEAARLVGMATGLVATSTVAQATPAAFASHIVSRFRYDDIMEQLVHQGIDVVLGGGKARLLPSAAGGIRADGEDLETVLTERGYRLVTTATELAGIRDTPVWGAFAAGDMEPEIDRPRRAPSQPTLAEMTEKAIELLAAEPGGFFLMVEGSQMDSAGHDNDPVYAVTELLAFDAAVAVAQRFTERDGNTMLIAFADHATGGLSTGGPANEADWAHTTIDDLVGPLRSWRVTMQALAAELGADPRPDQIAAAVKHWLSVDLEESEVRQIAELVAAGHNLGEAISRVAALGHTATGWSTWGHVGDDVPLWAWGPGRPAGLVANTEIARSVAAFLGLDLDQATKELFVDAREVFPDSVVDRSTAANPVLLAGSCRVTANRDTALCSSLPTPVSIRGVAVDVGDGRFFVPAAAVDILRRSAAKP